MKTLEETVLKGLPLSWGIAMGPLFFFTQDAVSEEELKPEKKITFAQVKTELARFEEALKRSVEDIDRLKLELKKENVTEGVQILDAHLQMMKDPGLIKLTLQGIQHLSSADNAFRLASKTYIDRFEAIEDSFFRERVKDVIDITKRIMGYLRQLRYKPWEEMETPAIIVAKEVCASQVAEFNPELILGILTEKGSSTSHAAIVARARGIPFLSNLTIEALEPYKNEYVIIDATESKLIINPEESRLKEFILRKEKDEKKLKSYQKLNSLKPETYDGYEVRISANIDVDSELDLIHQYGGQGVGLFRSEYVFLAYGKFPNEEEQYEIYKRIVDKLKGLPIVIRTFDVGADKGDFPLQAREDNPYLGCRAIRFLLKERKIFKTQLKAILRAAYHGDVSIMFPMVSGLSELHEAKKMLKEAEDELILENMPFKKKIRVGSMIEVPSAAIIADLIARECDFLSIGTNDLVQYSLAVDRSNQHLNGFYTPTHPGVIRLIKMVVNEANRQRIPVTVCGEIAADPKFTALLLGLGVHELSVAARYIPPVKEEIRTLSIVRAAALAEEVLNLSLPHEIMDLLEREYAKNKR